MEVTFYLIDWSKVEEKLFYRDFSEYITQNPNGEYNFTKPTETDWIIHVPLPLDASEYVLSSKEMEWMDSGIPLAKIMDRWEHSFQASYCFDINRLKLAEYIQNEFLYLLELMFYPSYDYFFIDHPSEFRDFKKILHKIISPTRIAVVLSLWKSRDYLSELQKVYKESEEKEQVTTFKEFSEYVKAWINLFERAYAKPGWGILVYF